jgi:hypothetical protein
MPTRTFSNPITEDVMGVNNDDGLRGDLVIAVSVVVTLLMVDVLQCLHRHKRIHRLLTGSLVLVE